MVNFTWFVFALLSAVFAAAVAIFAKIGLNGIDSTAATAIRTIIMAVFLAIVILVQGKMGAVSEIFASNRALTFIVLSGIAGAISWLFYFVAIQMGDVAKVAAIDRLSIVFIVVFALIFLGEKLDLKSWIGAGLISLGAILMAWK